MQKFLSFLAMGAIVLGMASCGGNAANNPEPKTYPVEVKSVTGNEIHVRITPNDKTKYFYCGIMDLKTFLDDTEKRVQTEIKTTVALAKVTNPNLKYPALLYQDFAERVFKDLAADTDYAIFMCVVDEDYKIVGDIEYAVITTESPILGPFTVDQNQQVRFSKGNLRYNPASGIWEFAENQYDFVGKGNAYISPNYDGWIDLFGWGTGDNPTLSTIENSDYATFTNWGNNPISNGGDKAYQWRTLMQSEWDYLLCVRANAKERFGFGTVDGVNGLIILPDNWTLPTGLNFTPSTKQGLNYHENYYYNANENNFSHNAFTAKQWADQMQPAGAVFLPAAGHREGTEVSLVGSDGHYWLSTPKKEGYASAGEFNSNALTLDYSYFVYRGRSVRLVQDVK